MPDGASVQGKAPWTRTDAIALAGEGDRVRQELGPLAVLGFRFEPMKVDDPGVGRGRGRCAGGSRLDEVGLDGAAGAGEGDVADERAVPLLDAEFLDVERGGGVVVEQGGDLGIGCDLGCGRRLAGYRRDGADHAQRKQQQGQRRGDRERRPAAVCERRPHQGFPPCTLLKPHEQADPGGRRAEARSAYTSAARRLYRRLANRSIPFF